MEARILKLYKEEGETPLECLNRFRSSYPEYKDVKMTYLGRLDPMAEGLLLVLAGNTLKKNDYLDLDKTYEFEVLWGVETDTYDILGLVSSKNCDYSSCDSTRISSEKSQFLSQFISKKIQQYPKYSSPRLYKENEGEIPEKEIEIYSLEYLGQREVSGEELLKDVENRIAKVKGEFRQNEIIKNWQDILSKRKDEKFLISKFVAEVSSGTYIRSLAHEMGKSLGCGSLAYSIKRTTVGDFTS